MTAPKKKEPRISESPKEFNIEIARMDDRLQALAPTSPPPPGTPINYWAFLGLTNVNASDFHNKRLFWNTPVTGLYAKYSDPTTSTSAVKTQVKLWIAAFRAFANPLLNIIAASPNATSDDETIFNLVLNVNRHHGTHTHTKIADKCVTEWAGEGVGTKKAASKSSADTKRHSLAAGADGVQYAYTIMDENPKTIQPRTQAVINTNNAAAAARVVNPTLPTPVPLPLPLAVPQHPQDGTTKEFFSGSTHQFAFGADKKGKYLYTWSRWYNSKHPEIAGDWNARQVELIK
ncbi:MAG TPA: hypothetical protein VF411_11940 [Bacteroidia bacterium]